MSEEQKFIERARESLDARADSLEPHLAAQLRTARHKALAGRHYAVHADKPFFGDLIDYITSTPIIAAPQVAILGVHKIVDKPVVRDGEIVVRPILNFGLSFDHRVIDGGYAVQFLRKMIEFLEDPDSWLLSVI